MTKDDLSALGLSDDTAQAVLELHESATLPHRTAAETWQQRHAEDTAALAQQLAQKDTQSAAEAALGTLHFSSASARKAFAAELSNAALPFDAQTQALAGFEAFVHQYRETDPAAFAAPHAEKLPVLVQPAQNSDPLISAGHTLRHAFGLSSRLP